MDKTKYICILLFVVQFLSVNADSKSDIDKLIHDLNYDPNVVLAYKGESVTSIPKDEGHLDDSKTFIVLKRERQTISNSKADVGVLTSNEHRTFPGSILLANSRLIDNSPDILPVERSPITYTVKLPGITDEGSFTIVPSFKDYQSNINNVLNIWFDKYSKNNDVTSIFQSEAVMAYSKEQLRVKFGMDFKNTDVEASIDFSSVNKQEKLILIHKFKQVFYTVSVASPKTPADLFASSVTSQQLSSKINNENPPVLVDSVSYGRTIYVKIETSSTDSEAKNILKTKLTNFNVGAENEVEYTKNLKNLNMQVYVMGGGTQHVALINAKTLKDVNDKISEYSKFKRDNLGFPLAYSTEFLKDNSRAVVVSVTEYTETSRTEYHNGVLKIKHTGWYVAQWKIEWDEITYDNDGNGVTTRKSWSKNWEDLTAPFSAEIQLDGNCRNIAVFAREATGLIWEWWRTVIDRSGIPLVNERTFSISGTTLNPSYSIDPPL